MADPKEHDAEPKQKTPQGAEIPVPKRGDFMRNLEKVSKPVRKEREEDREDSPPGR